MITYRFIKYLILNIKYSRILNEIYEKENLIDNNKERIVFAKNSEEFDANYYNFRMGLGNYKKRDISNLFLRSGGYLPVYNNSFYFQPNTISILSY